jgi:FlaA1/EpsC-like NDP-sugar epimerase
MTRFFMTIPEAAQLVLQAGAFGTSGDIFVLDMGEPVKVVDLARDLIRLSGLQEGRQIKVVFTGLRPGEKLYEELYADAETRLPTPHPQIFRARHRATSGDELRATLGRLAAAVDGPADEVIAALQAAIPEYRPNRASGGAVAPAREILPSRIDRGNAPHIGKLHAAPSEVVAS